MNTGELRVRARGGQENLQSWRHAGGRGSRANLNITVGSSSNASCSLGSDPDDHSDTISGATDLSPGSSQTGELTREDTDVFRVRVSQAGTLTVYTTGATDTVGRLLDSSGVRLTSNDDGGEGSNFRIERSVNAGTYYVEVTPFSSGGSYTVHAEFSGGSTGNDLYGALAVTNAPSSCGSRGWAARFNHETRATAEEAALAGCNEIIEGDQSWTCSNVLWWRNASGAYAEGDQCGAGWAWDPTRSTAERLARDGCNDQTSNCVVERSWCTRGTSGGIRPTSRATNNGRASNAPVRGGWGREVCHKRRGGIGDKIPDVARVTPRRHPFPERRAKVTVFAFRSTRTTRHPAASQPCCA